MEQFDYGDRCPYRIAELILARMAETATPLQQQELDAWIVESERNRELYRRITDGNQFVRYTDESQIYDFRDHLSVLENRIRRRRNRIARRSIGATALGASFFTFIFILCIQLFERPAENHVSIEPGCTRAQLTLADGSVVDLGPDTKPASIPGTNIVFEGDTLIYKDNFGDTTPKPQRITIPRGGEYFLRLSDGTGVWLNSETRLSYPTIFENGERKVFLSGEAYFEVVPDSGRPFIVESENQKVTVLGTSFAVRAYSDESAVFTTLESGRVVIETDGERIDLVPGMQSIVRGGEVEVRNVDMPPYTAWRTGRFIFEDQTLGEILTTLSRWYDIEVVYTRADIEKIRFTGELKRYSDIGGLLSRLESLEKVRFTVIDRTVTVYPY